MVTLSYLIIFKISLSYIYNLIYLRLQNLISLNIISPLSGQPSSSLTSSYGPGGSFGEKKTQKVFRAWFSQPLRCAEMRKESRGGEREKTMKMMKKKMMMMMVMWWWWWWWWCDDDDDDGDDDDDEYDDDDANDMMMTMMMLWWKW